MLGLWRGGGGAGRVFTRVFNQESWAPTDRALFFLQLCVTTWVCTVHTRACFSMQEIVCVSLHLHIFSHASGMGLWMVMLVCQSVTQSITMAHIETDNSLAGLL